MMIVSIPVLYNRIEIFGLPDCISALRFIGCLIYDREAGADDSVLLFLLRAGPLALLCRVL